MHISWNDVQEMIIRINTGAEQDLYRLPTEAEWEYAARAGTTTRWSFGEDESQLGEYAWNLQFQHAQPVGTKLPNPWGLYDMHGNVWEWVQDWWDRPYPSASQVDPQGPNEGFKDPTGSSLRVVRGGYYFGYYDRLGRSASRGYYSPGDRESDIGARLLRMGEPPTVVTPKTWGQIKKHQK